MKLKTVIKSSNIVLLLFTTLTGFLLIESVSAQNGSVGRVQSFVDSTGISLRIEKCQDGKYLDCITSAQIVKQTALTDYYRKKLYVTCDAEVDYVIIIDDNSFLIECQKQANSQNAPSQIENLLSDVNSWKFQMYDK